MSNFLIALAVFLITVIGALFAVPYFIDWNGYRGVFEEEATRLLGREVRVGGAVNLHVLPTPYFRFEKVRIADASVNLQEPFFRADSLTVKLNVAPLFRGAIEANEIEFERPVLRLALNEEDGWNWQSFGAALAHAAYLPTNVALASVRIHRGVLALHAPDGNERMRFSGIDAELSAPALRGPYRLRGTIGAGAEMREVRIATAEPEGDGSVRFKAVLGAGASADYTLEGRLFDLMGKPHVNGELTARLPLGGLLRAPSPPAGAAPPGTAGEGAVELRANVAAGAAGADLTDVALSFDQEGRPQLVSGRLKVQWRDALSLDMNLASPWLDVDHIAATGNSAGPLASVIPLALRLRTMLPDAHLRAHLAVEQANLGGEAVSGLSLDLARDQDNLEIEALHLGMPGGSHGELKGVVSGSPEAPQFTGSFSLRGTSIVRFSSWATGSALPLVAAGDGPFGLRARLAVDAGTAAASDIVGDLSATTIGGAVQYRWDGRRELSLQLDAPQLDMRAFLPAEFNLRDLATLAARHAGLPSPRPAHAAPDAKVDATARGSEMDVYLRLNAGELITGERSYRDVAAEVELRGGTVKVPMLRIAGDDGFRVELEGEVADAASNPKGTLRGAIGIDRAEGVAPAFALLGLGELVPVDARARAMVPMRLAGTARFGRRTPSSADLSLAGEANGASVRIAARFDGHAGGWRAGPADISALIESADGGRIAALLLPGQPPPKGEAAAAGRLLVAASGIPGQGLDTLASLEAGDLALRFRGQVIATAGDTTASGDLEVKTADAQRIAPLVGMPAASLRLDGVPVEGSLRVAVGRGSVRIDRMAVRVGGSEVNGKLLLSSLGERRRVEARFDVDDISLAQLLTPLLDQRLTVTGAAEAAISGQESPWPDEPFAATAFDALEGNIYLTSGHLLLAPGIGLRDATLDLGLGAGRLEVRKLEGRGLGGRVRASFSCEKVAGGVDVRGTLAIADANLETIAAGANAAGGATGGVTGDISFAGRGSSVRSVVSLLQGGGTLHLHDASLQALWPGAIARATEAALQSPPDKAADSLRQALLAGLAGGRLPLPEAIGVELADGQLRIKPLAIDTPQGRAAGGVSLDLRTLSVDADWRLEEPPAAGKEGQAPPAVGIGYRGNVLALGSLTPRIDSDALEREIAVRRVEHDVEELERLRRIDETRRREDADRLRRQLEQAPPPVPVAPATPPGRPARPG